MKTPQEIIDIMMEKDQFSNWLGLSVVEVIPGFCELSCTVKNEMLNGFNILHGGITYSLSDSALAFASNSKGQKCVSIETSISHLIPVRAEDKLRVITKEISRGKSIGTYEVNIFNSQNILVSKFKGTVSISKEYW